MNKMNKLTTGVTLLIAAAFQFSANVSAQTEMTAAVAAVPVIDDAVSFDNSFTSKTLRIDYFLAGDSKNETVYFSQMKEEPFWGGPHKNLVDPFGYGTYRYAGYDSATNKLLFSRGFSTLFQEWKGTDEAKKIKRAFPMTAVMPFPKNTIRFVIEKRSYVTN